MINWLYSLQEYYRWKLHRIKLLQNHSIYDLVHFENTFTADLEKCDQLTASYANNHRLFAQAHRGEGFANLPALLPENARTELPLYLSSSSRPWLSQHGAPARRWLPQTS